MQGTVTVALQAVPGVEGITIQPRGYQPDLVAKVKKKTKKLTTFVYRYQPPFKLALRCVHAYAVASVFYPRHSH